MRLWSIHPAYLDAVGLVALWREGLLAKAVLQGRTIGYRHHPQLARFRAQKSAITYINRYLLCVWWEAYRRGYSFDKRKIGKVRAGPRLPVTTGQLTFEFAHLRRKLRLRNRKHLKSIRIVSRPRAHPLFKVRTGKVEEWERG